MSRDAISLRETIPLRPTSAQWYAHRYQDVVIASVRPASIAEKGLTAGQRSTSRAPLGEFCVSLALWAAPGVLLMRSDAQAIVSDLFTNPLSHSPGTTLALALVLVYVVTTGLLIAASFSRLAQTRPRYVNICLFFVIAPAILVSLASTLTLSLTFFFSLLVWCFPALL